MQTGITQERWEGEKKWYVINEDMRVMKKARVEVDFKVKREIKFKCWFEVCGKYSLNIFVATIQFLQNTSLQIKGRFRRRKTATLTQKLFYVLKKRVNCFLRKTPLLFGQLWDGNLPLFSKKSHVLNGYGNILFGILYSILSHRP